MAFLYLKFPMVENRSIHNLPELSIPAWFRLMARYFFHLVSAQSTILDHEGVEVSANPGQSITEIIEEIRSEEPELFDDNHDWSIEVVDAEGRLIGKFAL